MRAPEARPGSGAAESAYNSRHTPEQRTETRPVAAAEARIGMAKSDPTGTAPGGDTPEAEAEYTLEYPLKCPWCNMDLEVLKVVRLLRTKVNFTSTLPRRGRVLACPNCQKVISAELAGFT